MLVKSKPFHASEFNWRLQYDEPVKVAEAVAGLNTLTPEQIKAVKYYVHSCSLDENDNNAGEGF